MKKLNHTAVLLGCLLLPFLAAGFGSLFMGAVDSSWYLNLVQPAWSPPRWLFGPAWTILYLLMGLASFFIWKSRKSKARTVALRLYAVQLVVNAIWTPIFFGAELVGLAFLDILILDMLVLMLIIKAWKVEKWAAIALLPYIGWILFATTLNGAILRLN